MKSRSRMDEILSPFARNLLGLHQSSFSPIMGLKRAPPSRPSYLSPLKSFMLFPSGATERLQRQEQSLSGP